MRRLLWITLGHGHDFPTVATGFEDRADQAHSVGFAERILARVLGTRKTTVSRKRLDNALGES